MSNEVLPRFPGLSIVQKWTPIHNTIVHQSATRIESRATYEAYPLWQISLKYELLRSGNEAELQAIAGFFMRHSGMLEDFLYEDGRDSSTSNDVFGRGDGVTKSFRLWRTWGNSRAPVSAVKILAGIMVNGVAMGAGFTIDMHTGWVTFAVAPAEDAELTWSGEYYWRVRFRNDDLEFEQFMHQWWQAGKIELITVKTL